MELLGEEPELEKFCRRDPLLRFIAFNARITCGLECVKSIVSCPDAREGSHALFTELRKLEDVDIPSQLQKLLSSTQNRCVNEQLLGSLIHNRVHKLAKLEMLNSKLLYQINKVEVSPTNRQTTHVQQRLFEKVQPFANSPHRHSLDNSVFRRQSIGDDTDPIVSAFDPLCDSTNTYQSPAGLPSLQKEDLIWFSPSITIPGHVDPRKKTKAAEPLSSRASCRKPLKRAKSAEDMISF